METLPSSIETYLSEAGFSGTEIIILKKLLEEDALTLRELAAKTGKSTGVLDQAAKKLLKKKILSRETINDAPKYVLHSLNAILAWMEEDMKLKQEMMLRRHESFESFVRSLALGKRRPEMEYFEGPDGIRRAYTQILDRGNDIVQYGPVLYLAEEDPLRDFRVQWFRERRNRGIFSRVITHDTPLGRRFKSRDVFEYRKTILVDPHAYPFNFEKMIVGDTVACFQLEAERACFIKYPEMAHDERLFFERLWNKKVEYEKNQDTSAADSHTPPPPAKSVVPLKTKTFSQLREFFLSRKGIITMGLLGFLSAALTYSLYQYNLSLNLERVRERAKSIAATGALQFDANDIELLRSPEDIDRPEYKKVIFQLNEIRRQNEGVTYIYIMRPTNDPNTMEFVADADSLDPYIKRDLNGDGIIDDADWLSPPGESYDISNLPAVHQLFRDGVATADIEPYEDQWGSWISGHGPIVGSGTIIAMLGVDIDVNRVEELAQSSFVAIYWFIGFLFLFLLIRLAAFNRSLMKELWDVFRVKSYVLLLVGGLSVVSIAGIALQRHAMAQELTRLQTKAMTTAITGSLQFTAEEFDGLRTLKDVETPAYASAVRKLLDIQRLNAGIRYVYVLRPTPERHRYEFVAASDALHPLVPVDGNGDGEIDDQDEIVYPGLSYDVQHIHALNQGMPKHATATAEPYSDQWGTFITAYAPIRSGSGVVQYLLAVDIELDPSVRLNMRSLFPLAGFIMLCALLFLFGYSGFKKSLLKDVLHLLMRRSVLLRLLTALIILESIVFGLYVYTVKFAKEQAGLRMMSIAATAASQINPADLEPLRFARDMKREEYQRVFSQLNDIRYKNPDITYAYIMRPTDVEGMWEFVADADSNYYIPEYFLDYNKDSEITEADQNVAPGVRYDIAFASPIIFAQGLLKPVVEHGLQDQWGATMTASAPIYKNNNVIAILGIDIFIDGILDSNRINILKNLQISIFVLILFFLSFLCFSKSK